MGNIESIHEETNDIFDNYLVHYEPTNNNNNNNNNNNTIKELMDRIKHLENNYKKQEEELNNLKKFVKN